MPPDSKIQLACQDDIDRIVAIARQHCDILGFFPKGGFVNPVAAGEVIVSKTKHGKINGFLHYHTSKDRTTVVYAFAVDKNSQGQGIGTALMNCLFNLAKRQHVYAVRLKVPEDAPAVEFYKAKGFEVIGLQRYKTRNVLVLHRKVWQ
jgi:ribosomal protein S18 acetylase RimI-like enzyme